MTEVNQDKRTELAKLVLAEWEAKGRDWDKTVEAYRLSAERATECHGMAIRVRDAIRDGGGQLPLPGVVPEPEKRTRAKRRVMMHFDAEHGVFKCRKCTNVGGVGDGMSEADRRKGIPCPKCNAAPTPMEGDK